jgi:hypothetical protein
LASSAPWRFKLRLHRYARRARIAFDSIHRSNVTMTTHPAHRFAAHAALLLLACGSPDSGDNTADATTGAEAGAGHHDAGVAGASGGAAHGGAGAASGSSGSAGSSGSSGSTSGAGTTSQAGTGGNASEAVCNPSCPDGEQCELVQVTCIRAPCPPLPMCVAPKTVSCDPAKILCKLAVPECPEGQVPSVSGSCYGPCVRVETCPCTQASECPNHDSYTCHMSAAHCGPYV